MPVSAEFQKGGKVKVGDQVFDSVEAYADSGVANADVLGALRTANAAALAEAKALVGSSSHHMQRGAAAHFHYDQQGERGTDEAQAWAGAVPVARATGLPESAAPGPEGFYQDPPAEAGYAATTGTGEESVQAQKDASESQRTYDEVVEGRTRADEADTASDTGTGRYEDRSMAQIRATARREGVSAGGSKADIIARLRGDETDDDEGHATPLTEF